MRTARRFLVAELDGAIAKLDRGGLSDRDVHAIRKKLKRVRAALRLLRPWLGSAVYRRENASVRDAARPLTPLRDAAVLPRTLRRLQARPERLGGGKSSDFAGQLKRLLRRGRHGARRQMEARDLEEALRRLRACRRRIGALGAPRPDRTAPVSGLERTYKAGRNALADVTSLPSDEHLHEWRKQVTYLANQLECLAPPDSKIGAARLNGLRRLAALLGEDHDLAVLNRTLAEVWRQTQAAPADAMRGGGEARELAQRLAGRRERLQGKAYRLGRRLYARRPRRIAASWLPIDFA